MVKWEGQKTPETSLSLLFFFGIEKNDIVKTFAEKKLKWIERTVKLLLLEITTKSNNTN